MGKEDYASTGTTALPPPKLPALPRSLPRLTLSPTGGALKLKGTIAGGIKKKKKKSKQKSASAEPESSGTPTTAALPPQEQEQERQEEDDDPYAGKTEAERRFEQRRLEQMEKRLAKEGIKTHKERVDEYNKYLASLSEHHDMYVLSCGCAVVAGTDASDRPRIGPG